MGAILLRLLVVEVVMVVINLKYKKTPFSGQTMTYRALHKQSFISRPIIQIAIHNWFCSMFS